MATTAAPTSLINTSPTKGYPPSAKRPVPRTVLNVLLYIYFATRTFLAKYWIKLNRWIDQPDGTLVVRSSVTGTSSAPPFHKAIVVGDGFALGMGDSGVIGGTTAGVSSHLLQAAALDPGVRRRWKVVNRGEMDGLTSRWLPNDGTLYRSLFSNDGKGAAAVGSDADVVILMMGTADVIAGLEGMPLPAMGRDMMNVPYPPEELAVVVKNISRLAEELQNQGRRVCVVDMPTSGLPNAGRGKMRRLNQQLRQVINEVNSKVDSKGKTGSGGGRARVTNSSTLDLYPIQYMPLGNNHRLMRQEFRAFDGLHLNRKGYRALALDLFTNGGVKSMMVNAEWAVWKSELKKEGLSSHEKAIRDGKLDEAKAGRVK